VSQGDMNNSKKELICWESKAVSQYDQTKPWNRQPLDDDEGWALFRLYLMLPIPRNLALFEQRHVIDGKILRKLHRKNHWQLRAKAFDNEVHKRFQDSVLQYVEDTAVEYGKRHIQILTKTGVLAERELNKLIEASMQSEGIGLIRTRDLIRLIEQTVKLERLVRGDSTEKVEIDNLDGLSIDELHKLKQLQKKAQKGVKDD
jgi:hypothetical protein